MVDDCSAAGLPAARSAYLHIPFCTHRCGYCNFTVVAGRGDLVDRFLDALERELCSLAQPHEVDTLFLGGGTPTFLGSHQLDRLLALCIKWLPLAPGGEWSCEANPLDCTDDKLDCLRDAGVNRISLGGQSFNDRKLAQLERDHSGDQLSVAIGRCHDYFPQVSLDLIFAAPCETLDQWLMDLKRALEHSVQHISTYGLTIEKGAAFYGRQMRGELTAVTEELELAMYHVAIDALTAASFQHYEVSNFAQDGYACRHNESYWLARPWLAFGPGAAGFDGRARFVNHRSLHTYLRRIEAGDSPVEEREELSDEQLLRERVVFGLRRLAGVDLAELASPKCPRPADLFEPYLSRAIDSGWIAREGHRLRLTREGLVVSDMLWPDFL